MLLLLLPGIAWPQESRTYLDSLFVEVYHVHHREDEAPLITYRLFADLASDVHLQMVFGSEENQLRITTTTDFFNDTDHGAVFGWQVPSGQVAHGMLSLDSWLTLGAATDDHWGVPLSMDTDGSLMQCPGKKARRQRQDQREQDGPRVMLCERDGLVAADSMATLVNFLFEPGYLRNIRGSSLHTMTGAWASLGGVRGPTKENIVLIGQLTTTGELTYELNLQVGLQDGSFRRLVHSHAEGPFEVLQPGLIGHARP